MGRPAASPGIDSPRVLFRRRARASRALSLAFGFWLMAAGGGRCAAQVNVLTANGSNDRTNANLQETRLSPVTVTPASFGKVQSLAVDGQVYAQVLYASSVVFRPHEVHNAAIVCTMHNSVYAFDADPMSGGRLLWRVNLGPSVPSSIDIAPEIGILSTGVIDLGRGLLYVVAETLQNGGPVFSLHALDLTSGAERQNGPVIINASAAGAMAGQASAGTISLDPNQLLQRPGLLLANGSVYIAFGSHADQPPWHGWIVSYDASDLSRQTGVFNTTPAGQGGAVWQSGRGLAADESGNIYAVSGNGDFDGMQNFGESFLKLPGSLGAPLDWLTPGVWQDFSEADVDLSAGPALISGTHFLLGADKAGNLYAADGDSMGHLGGGSAYSAGGGYIFNFAVWSKSGGAIVYVQPKGGPLQSYRVLQDQLSFLPLSSRPLDSVSARVGMTLSANGSDDASGILWQITAGSDGSGTLHAFDASDLSRELWNSGMNPARDALGAYAKFVSPTVVNGLVFVPTFSNAVAVYGLLSQAHWGRASSHACDSSAGSTGVSGAAPASDNDRSCVLGSGRDHDLK